MERREFFYRQLTNIENMDVDLGRAASTRRLIPQFQRGLFNDQLRLIEDARLDIAQRVGFVGLALNSLADKKVDDQPTDYLLSMVRVPSETFSISSYSPMFAIRPDDEPEIKKIKASLYLTLEAGFMRGKERRLEAMGGQARSYDQVMEERGWQNGFSTVGFFRHHQRLASFAHAGPINVQVDGLSLRQLLDSREPVSPVSLYRFLIENIMSYAEPDFFDKIQQDSWGELAQMFPQVALKNILEARELLYGAFELKHYTNWKVLFKDIATVSKSDAKVEDARRVENLIIHLRNASERFGDIRRNPKNQAFPEMAGAITEYLQMGGETALVALLISRALTDAEAAKSSYRQAQSFAQQGIYPEFHNLYSQAIHNVVTEQSHIVKMHTDSTLLSIIQEEKLEVDRTPVTPAELASEVDSITSKRATRNIDFLIDNDTLAEVGLVPADDAVLRFDPNRPRIFTITLTYNDEVGEADVFRFDFDTSKQAKVPFEWGALELPEQLPLIRDHILAAARIVLAKERERAEQLYREKELARQAATAVTPTVSPKSPRMVPSPRIPKEPNREKVYPKQGFSVIEQELMKGITPSEDTKPKTKLDMPEDLREVFKGNWSEDQIRRVVEGVTRRNLHGNFDIVPISDRTGPNGESMLRVRIGPFRVLVTPDKDANGAQVCRVIEVRKKAGDKTYSSTTLR